MHFITNGYKRFSKTNLPDPRQCVSLRAQDSTSGLSDQQSVGLCPDLDSLCPKARNLKEHVAMDRTSWSLKSVITRNCTVILLGRELTRSAHFMESKFWLHKMADRVSSLSAKFRHVCVDQMLFKDQLDRSKATCSFNHYHFILRMGWKAVGPLCCVLHV